MIISQLVEEMATQLDIQIGNNESSQQWKKRVLYSSIAIQMLSASHDYDNDSYFDKNFSETSVSMQHILNRGMQLSDVYKSVYGFTEFVTQDTVKNIRNLYMQTGFLLHKSNRLSPPSKTIAECQGVTFIRGGFPWEVVEMSGAGTIGKSNSTTIRLGEMFAFETYSIEQWFARFKESIPWTMVNGLPANLEYGNILESASKGYWLPNRPKRGLTICRDKVGGPRTYRMLDISDSVLEYRLPSWRVDKKESFRILLALRVLARNRPKATIKNNGSIALISLGFSLPPAEQRFFELYSWPTEKNSQWERIVSIKLVGPMATLLTNMGFDVQEE